MANPEHINVLRNGQKAWNSWRSDNPDITPDLSGIYLGKFLDASRLNVEFGSHYRSNFSGYDFRNAILDKVVIGNFDLSKTLLSGASFRYCDFTQSVFWGKKSTVDLRATNFSFANLEGVQLINCNLNNSIFEQTNLTRTIFDTCSFNSAKISDCIVYGTSVWNSQFNEAIQKNLRITNKNENTLTVDQLTMAQFIYLMLENHELRNIIDTLTSKTVLILGRFTTERKKVLDAVKQEIRNVGLAPVLFDFDKPLNRDLTETIILLASMSKFVVADLTNPSSIPHELGHIIPHNLSIPILPIIESRCREYSMFEHWQRYPHVRDIESYENEDDLLKKLPNLIDRCTANPI